MFSLHMKMKIQRYSLYNVFRALDPTQRCIFYVVKHQKFVYLHVLYKGGL